MSIHYIKLIFTRLNDVARDRYFHGHVTRAQGCKEQCDHKGVSFGCYLNPKLY